MGSLDFLMERLSYYGGGGCDGTFVIG